MNSTVYLIIHACLGLKKNLGFALGFVSTMGITLGSLLCISTLAYVILIKPLPYPKMNDLYKFSSIRKADQNEKSRLSGLSYSGLLYLYENQKALEKVALIYNSQELSTLIPGKPTLQSSYVTPEWMDILNAPIILGRRFESSEAIDSYNPVAIISYETWQKEFNGSDKILEQKLSLNNVSFNIVGVTSSDFSKVKIDKNTTQIWLPWDYNGLSNGWNKLSRARLFGISPKNIAISQAEQSISSHFAAKWKEENRNAKGVNINIVLRSLKSSVIGNISNTIYLLLAGILGVLVIACTNIANLLISQTFKQQHKVAIQVALGATKKHIFKALLVEYGILMLFSILVGLIVSAAGFFVIQEYLSSIFPRIEEISTNYFTFGISILIVGIFSLLFSIFSTYLLNYRSLGSLLKTSGKGVSLQVSKVTRNAIIASQVAVAFTLLFINSNLINASLNKIYQPFGHDSQNVISILISNLSTGKMSADENKITLKELKRTLLLSPDIDSVSLSASPLDLGGSHEASITVVDSNRNDISYRNEGSSQYFEVIQADDSYFSVLGQPLVEGDYFSKSDIRNKAKKIIINDVFANEISPNTSVIGKKVSFDNGEYFDIVGVVKGAMFVFDDHVPKRYYFPSSGGVSSSSKWMMIKLKDNQHLNQGELESRVRSVNTISRITHFEYIDDTITAALFPYYITASMTLAVVLISLLLVGVGLYGILSYSTEVRRFEFATRLAIGAKPNSLVQLIIVDNITSILLGISVGIIIMLAIYLGFSEELIGYISSQLIPMFLLTLFLISTVAFSACYFPLQKILNLPIINTLKGFE